MRLIMRDGSLMWKHALLQHNQLVYLPQNKAHEAHIVKTAQRIEAWLGITGLSHGNVLCLICGMTQASLNSVRYFSYFYTLYTNERVYFQLKSTCGP